MEFAKVAQIFERSLEGAVVPLGDWIGSLAVDLGTRPYKLVNLPNT